MRPHDILCLAPVADGLPMSGMTILLLAAGSSSRMRGRDKLLELIDDVPLLRRQAMAAVAAQVPVVVTLPPKHRARLAALCDLPLAIVEVPQAADGMGKSLRLGAMAAGATDLLVMLADMPEIEASDLVRLIEAFHTAGGTHIIRAGTETGQPGHPVIFPVRCLADFADLRGDTGARAILAAHRDQCITLPLAGQRAVVDLDTPEAWATWRANRP